MKVERLIPLSVPNLSGNEAKYVKEAIEAEWVSTAGEKIKEFEINVANFVKSKGSVACQSGTAGIHMCLRYFGISEEDIVIVPTLTFIATVNPIIYENAEPIFFDCDENLNIDVEQIENYLKNDCFFVDGKLRDKEKSKFVKAIIPVHVFGDVCDMSEIMRLSEEYNLIVIEDATEALGSRFLEGKYKGKYAGTVGHAGVFSFNGNKIITTGGGGMVVSNTDEVVEKIKYLSQQAKNDKLYFVHDEIGFNYRMTNIQAAMGLAQMEQLQNFINIKKDNFEYYVEKLKDCKIGEMKRHSNAEFSNHWFYIFQLNDKYIDERDNLIIHLNERDIQVRPIWKLNHLQKPFSVYKHMRCSRSISNYAKTINLPCSSNLKKQDIDRVCKVLTEYVPKAR